MDNDTSRHRHNFSLAEQDHEARRNRRLEILDGVASGRKASSPTADGGRAPHHESGSRKDDRDRRRSTVDDDREGRERLKGRRSSGAGETRARSRSRDSHRGPRRRSLSVSSDGMRSKPYRSRRGQGRDYKREEESSVEDFKRPRHRSRSGERTGHRDTRRRGDGRHRRRSISMEPRDRSTSPLRDHRSSGRPDRSPASRKGHRRRHRSPSSPPRSVSPPARKRHRPTTSPPVRSRQPLPSQQQSYQQEANPDEDAPPEKQKPNFSATGLLAKEANRVAGTDVVLKYHEPADARKPPSRDEWRLYVFKGAELLQTLPLRERSCWLVGREVRVVDLPAEHPSCSKQHAVVQFRHTTRTNEYGDKDSRVRPYLIDLESSNGTSLNGEKVEASRYVELRDGDVVKFGLSEREYVIQLPPSGG